jgi:hypothetical protein
MWWFWKTKTSHSKDDDNEEPKGRTPEVHSVHQHARAHAYAPNTRGGKGKKVVHTLHQHTHAHIYAKNVVKEFFFGWMIEPRFAVDFK